MNRIQITPSISLVPVPAFKLVFGPEPDQYLNLPADVALALAKTIFAYFTPPTTTQPQEKPQ